METYDPSAIVLQCGTDSLSGDKLGCLNLSMRGRVGCRSIGFFAYPGQDTLIVSSSSSLSTNLYSSLEEADTQCEMSVEPGHTKQASLLVWNSVLVNKAFPRITTAMLIITRNPW